MSEKVWRVLLVDDEGVILMVVRTMLCEVALKGEIVKTVERPSVKTALAAIAEEETFDLIISDLCLPPHEEGGLQIFEAARKKDPKVPFVLLSGTTIGQKEEDGFYQLGKPVNIRVFANMVKQALNV